MNCKLWAIAAAFGALVCSCHAGVAAPSEADRQAAYCMEASFGYLQQSTKLDALLQSNREKIAAIALSVHGSQAEQQKVIAEASAKIDDSIKRNTSKRDRWKSDLDIYMLYLKRRGLLDGPNADLSAIKEMSPKVREDQIAVQSIYVACLKSCTPDSMSCKSACDKKANTSEPSNRMLRCGDLVGQFR
jgi:hypothetical protein